jgi:membrane associated rhomboid family serine protease
MVTGVIWLCMLSAHLPEMSFFFVYGSTVTWRFNGNFWLNWAQALFIYQNRKFFKNSRAMLTNTFVVIAINLFVIGSLQFVDNFGHLGGLLGGALFAWLAGPIWVPSGVFPVIEISDRRKNSRTLPVALGVFMLFALVAASKFIIK